LIKMFQKQHYEQYGLRKKFSYDALDLLFNYAWPGNVRELKYVVEYLYLICPQDNIDAVYVKKQLNGQGVKGGSVDSINGIVPSG